MKKIIAYYAIFLGVSIIGMWIMILATEVIPEGKTEIAFHLFSEFSMAIICIIGGISILKELKYAKRITILGFGMGIYSVINAAGYYAEKSELAFVILFAVIFILTMIALINLLFKQ